MDGQEATASAEESRLEAGGTELDKTVPVAEAIRYRKRAQSAEKALAEAQEALLQQRQAAEGLGEQLAAVRQEQALRAALTAAGTTDLETTLLLARARLDEDESADVEAVIEQLRSDKAHLFAADKQDAAPVRTAVLKHRSDPASTLDSAATQAAHSGSRADMQAYLRLRRNYV